jgi:hypothetical protein
MAGVPEWLNIVRAHRPSHAVNALGRTPDLLLLNPRDLRDAVEAPLLRLAVPLAVLLPGIFRAARDAAAIVGLVKPGATQGDGPAPTAFAQSVFSAASAVGFQGPFFLASVPLALDASDAGGERLRAELQRYLDAGFTEIMVQAEGHEPLAAAAALATSLEAARERDVAVGIWSATEEGALNLHAGLRRKVVQVDLVSIGAEVASERIGPLIDLLRPSRLELQSGTASGGGLGGLDASAPVQALARSQLGQPVAPEHYRAGDDLPAERRERMEALVYADLLGVLQDPALRGTASRALTALSARRDA